MMRIITGTSRTTKSRHDQEEHREEHLHRRLLRALLGVGPAPLPQLDREVPHDLAGRDAERLALGDRAGEHAHARGVDTREEVLQSLDERQAHVLLLQREAHLAVERLLDLRRREAQRLQEAQAGLERDRSGRSRSGRSLLDLLPSLLGPRVHDRHRNDPADRDRGDRPTTTNHRRRPRALASHSQTKGDGAEGYRMPRRRSGVVVYMPAAMRRAR
jgi:hypothetical protein